MTEIETIKGNLLEVQAGFIIHGCNAQGVMGSGVARGIKAVFPAAYNVYRDAFETGKLKLGTLTLAHVTPSVFIINAVTQDSFGAGLQVDYQAIYVVFAKAREIMNLFDPAEELPICFPLIGAGRGGGDWAIISTMIETAFAGSKRKLQLYVVDAEPDNCR